MMLKLGGGVALALAVGLALYGAGVGTAADRVPQSTGAGIAPAPSAAPAMLPPRLLDCTLGRIANFDPNRIQQPSEYVFEGRHVFKLFLPPIPVRTTPPPPATAPAEPVDPRTRILSDPDGLAREAGGRPFDRVIDLWPRRVEMLAPISDVAVKMIIIDRIDGQRGTADMFVTNANDAATFDTKNMYFGNCNILDRQEAG